MSSLAQWSENTGMTNARLRGQMRRAEQIEKAGGVDKWLEVIQRKLQKLGKTLENPERISQRLLAKQAVVQKVKESQGRSSEISAPKGKAK